MPEEPKEAPKKTSSRKKESSGEEPKPKRTRSTAKKTKAETAPTLPEGDAIVGTVCPLCGKGTILKGKTAYGCSEWKNGCTFRKSFDA